MYQITIESPQDRILCGGKDFSAHAGVLANNVAEVLGILITDIQIIIESPPFQISWTAEKGIYLGPRRALVIVDPTREEHRQKIAGLIETFLKNFWIPTVSRVIFIPAENLFVAGRQRKEK